MNATFMALYGGVCDSCTEQIRPGDQCTDTEDVIVHADCEEAIDRERATVTCTSCWLQKPCPCEDDQ